jgi:hypothetical protein
MAASIEPTLYPHIFDCIAGHATFAELMRLRLVSRGARRAADAVLFRHVILQRPIADRDLPAKYFPTRAYSSSAKLSSERDRRQLPVAPFERESFSASLSESDGWAHTRVVDFDANVSGLHEQVVDGQRQWKACRLPKLEMVRRHCRSEDVFVAPTLVDVLRLPPFPKVWPCDFSSDEDQMGYDSDYAIDENRGSIPQPFKGYTDRHVILVLYDPELPLYPVEVSSGWGTQLLAETDCVFIFMECKAINDSREYEFQNDEWPTFLHQFIVRAAFPLHKSYTFVGLEGVPLDILKAELRLRDRHLVFRDDPDEWANVLEDGVIAMAGYVKPEERPDDGERVPITREPGDNLEVITLDEYRQRVGDEIFDLETFADMDRRHIASPW